MVITSFHIFLIIVFSLIVIFLIVISIVCFIKKLKLKNNNKVKHTTEEIRPNSIASTLQSSVSTEGTAFPNPVPPENKKEKYNKDYLSKEMKINAFCNCFLKPLKFSLIKVYNDSCPIDLVPFNENDDVSVTKCSHAFHFNCIKNYFLENESNNEFKCPICLTPLFEMNIKI
jgi:hypothetical protein